MGRGSRELFEKIFAEPIAEKHRKGRSQVLNARRNQLLIDRYYFYGEFSGKRYDIVIKRLSDEFFLSPVTIPEIIDDNYSLLKTTKTAFKELERETVIKKLKEKWPHLVWAEALT